MFFRVVKNFTLSDSSSRYSYLKYDKTNSRIRNLELALQLEQTSPDMLLTAKRTLELANKAYFLYVTQNPTEQGKLLKKVLLNCRVDGVSLYPTYRKPFDLIFNRAKNHEWSGREDLNLRRPGPETIAKLHRFAASDLSIPKRKFRLR